MRMSQAVYEVLIECVSNLYIIIYVLMFYPHQPCV